MFCTQIIYLLYLQSCLEQRKENSVQMHTACPILILSFKTFQVEPKSPLALPHASDAWRSMATNIMCLNSCLTTFYILAMGLAADNIHFWYVVNVYICMTHNHTVYGGINLAFSIETFLTYTALLSNHQL